MVTFTMWRLVKSTVIKKQKELYKLLKAKGCTKTFRTDDIVEKTKLTLQGKEVPLYRVTVAELGLKFTSSYWEIREAAKQLGFELIPLELLVQLRLDYEDQPIDEVIFAGTKTFSFKGCRRAIFGIKHDHLGKRFCIEDIKNSSFSPKTTFVFTRPIIFTPE